MSIQDTLKVSGTQVSPVEIEDTILAHPEYLVSDVAVAGVPGTRMDDELVPRAWVILSADGRRRGERYVVSAIDNWVRTRLSRPKWLRGGVQVVSEVRGYYDRPVSGFKTCCTAPDTQITHGKSFEANTTAGLRAGCPSRGPRAVEVMIDCLS